MNRKVLFSLILMAGIVPIISLAQQPASDIAQQEIIYAQPTEKTIQKVGTAPIEDGSQITFATVSVDAKGQAGKTCQLELIDTVMNRKPVSGTFPCNAVKSIQLNQWGLDAIEFNLNKDETKFTVAETGTHDLVPSILSDARLVYDAPSYFAKIENNIVTAIIVAEPEFVATQGGEWIETKMDGSIRANYAGIGSTYDRTNDVFISQQPFESWTLDQSYTWQPPVPYPNDGNSYRWDEQKMGWVLNG